MHTELHWLDVPERVKYKLGVITRRCLYGSAVSPAYNIWLSGLFSSQSDVLKHTAQKLA